MSNRVRYYLTEAIRDSALLGVAVVRIEFDDLEATWERGGERVLVTDADGVVFLASDPAFKSYRVMEGAKSKHLATESAPPNYPESMTRPLDLTVLERRGANAIVRVRNGAEDVTYLYQTLLPLPEYGWTIHRFAGSWRRGSRSARRRDHRRRDLGTGHLGRALSGAAPARLACRAAGRRPAARTCKSPSARVNCATQMRCCRPRWTSAAAPRRVCARPRTSWCRPASSQRSGRCPRPLRMR